MDETKKDDGGPAFPTETEPHLHPASCPKCGAARILYTRIEGCVARHYLACDACGEEPKR